MRLLLLTALVMLAFAGNSLLNRLALAGADGTGPAAFALVRLASGAAVLLAIVILRSRKADWAALVRPLGAGALALYVLGFSFAYVTLQAGVGALILFGGVQITMFAGALLQGERIAPRRWLGAGIAFAGLVVLLWPQGAAVPDGTGAALMAAAAVGWGVYSLLGRGASDPTGATAVNFALALPLGVIVFVLQPDGLGARGAVLAVVSGALTSGAGYALWYAVLPRLAPSAAAVAQLTVPVIAAAGGLLLLGELPGARFILASALVLGGVGLSLMRRSARR
jgi:drug/metabolite transporter (DMT)-like permease